MNVKEIKEFLTNDPDGRALFQEMTEGLKNSRDKILGEKKDLQDRYSQLEGIHADMVEHSKIELIQKNEKIKDYAIEKVIRDYGIDGPFQDLFKFRLEKDNLSINEDNTVNVGAESLSSYMDSFKESGEIKKYQSAKFDVGAGAIGGGATGMSPEAYSSMTREQLLNQL